MWQLITGFKPDAPPECSNHEFLRPDGTIFSAWTYGGLLLDSKYHYQDLDLRRVIAQCMGKSCNVALDGLEAAINSRYLCF